MFLMSVNFVDMIVYYVLSYFCFCTNNLYKFFVNKFVLLV